MLDGLSAGRRWLVSAKEAIKLFAHKQRMRLSSAQADIEIQEWPSHNNA